MTWGFGWYIQEKELGRAWGRFNDYSPIFVVDFAGITFKNYLKTAMEEDMAREQAIQEVGDILHVMDKSGNHLLSHQAGESYGTFSKRWDMPGVTEADSLVCGVWSVGGKLRDVQAEVTGTAHVDQPAS